MNKSNGKTVILIICFLKIDIYNMQMEYDSTSCDQVTTPVISTTWMNKISHNPIEFFSTTDGLFIKYTPSNNVADLGIPYGTIQDKSMDSLYRSERNL